MFDTSVVRNIEALDAADPYDVCIIGSGPAGTVLGLSLIRSRVRTLIVESGGSLGQWMTVQRLKGLAAYSVSGDTNYPIKRTTARARGGNSNFWTGRCERYHPSDFDHHPYTPPDNPWPLTYEELEPYYEQAEATLRVRGGEVSKHMPPRRTPWPIPVRSDIPGLKARMAKVGIAVDSSPTATPRRALRFFRVQRELLPEFLASPHGTLVSGGTVTRLLSDDTRRIVGTEVCTLDRTRKIARAKLYVVACGGIETPRLLLLSHSDVFPRGIGNACDRVGRGFNEHPGVNFYGKLRHGWDTLLPRHNAGRCHQFYDHFRSMGLGSVVISMIQSWALPHHLMRPSELVRDIMRVPSRVIRPTLYMGPTVEMVPRDENRITLSDTARDCFGNPLAHLTMNFSDEDRRMLHHTKELIRQLFKALGVEDVREGEFTYARHHIGACRMGDDPKKSVTDRHLRVHACPNLYLSGCETFVTGGSVPPVLTITALAHRLADHLITRLHQI